MTKKVLFPLVATALFVVTGCTPTPSSSSEVSSVPSTSSENSSVVSSEVSSSEESIYEPDLSKNVGLRLSVHYQDEKTWMTFGTTYPNYTDPAGNTYKTGDFKPAWKTLQTRLNFKITDVHNGSKVDESYGKLKNDANGAFTGADVLMGKASAFAEDGVSGDYFVNMLDHMDKMPNFKKFLQENPIVKLTITSQAYTTDSTAKPAIYYAPYFDGFNDLERMSMLRVDWVKKLLDQNSTYDTAKTLTTKYTKSVTVKGREVTVPANIEGTSTKKITRSATVTNIIDQMNALTTKNGATLANCLKQYIKDAYGNQYANPSDLYCGFDAAYDADEYIALLRVVKANPQLLAGQDDVVPFYPRAYTNDRLADIYRWAGQLFGVRGLESRSNYLYVNKEGKVVDARGDLVVAETVGKLHDLYEEGLILKDFDAKGNSAKGNWNDDYLKSGKAFATYDYCQTQTAYNETVDRTKEKLADFDFEPIMGAVADLDDGTTGNYIHFTESWRSVKTEGWGITKAAAADPDKLDRALALVDYFYSDAGNMLMSYGPEELGYIKKDAQGNIQYIDYNGKKVPELSDAMLAQLRDKKLGNWNYTNYYRYYVGSTYPVGYVKQQGMEYQCTTEQGKAGLKRISAAINAGTLNHPTVDNFTKDGSNPFYDLVPTTFRVTSSQASDLASYTGLANITSEKNKPNVWHDYVKSGYGATVSEKQLAVNPAALVKICEDWKVKEFGNIYNAAYESMIASY